MIGHGNPVEICSPPGGSVMPCSAAYLDARPAGQKLALAKAASAKDGEAADRRRAGPRPTSAEGGSRTAAAAAGC